MELVELARRLLAVVQRRRAGDALLLRLGAAEESAARVPTAADLTASPIRTSRPPGERYRPSPVAYSVRAAKRMGRIPELMRIF